MSIKTKTEVLLIIELLIGIVLLYNYIIFFVDMVPVKCKAYGQFNMGYGVAFLYIFLKIFILNISLLIVSMKTKRKLYYILIWTAFILLALIMPFPC